MTDPGGGYTGPYPQSWTDTYNAQTPGTQAAIGARYGGMSPDAIMSDWGSNVAPTYAAGTSPEAILGGAPTAAALQGQIGGLQGLIAGPGAAPSGNIPGTAMGRSSAKAFNANRTAQRTPGIVNRTLTPELRSRFGLPAAPAASAASAASALTTDMPYGGDVTQPTAGLGGAGPIPTPGPVPLGLSPPDSPVTGLQGLVAQSRRNPRGFAV